MLPTLRPIRLVFLLLTPLVSLAACYAPTVARDRSYHPSDADLTVTRIVHASVIIDFGTTRILVDPWFSPGPPIGQRETIGIAPDRLPPMRGILITHRHTDHYDRDTLDDYPDKRVRVVAARGLGMDIRGLGYADVVEVDAWERTQIGDVIVTAVPSRHGVPEVGYILQADSLTVYVAGDTLFDGDQFLEIAKAFPRIDVALLPVGGVRIFGRRLDMGAEDAARAVALLKPRRVIPYHYGLTGPFPFIFAPSDPANAFAEAVKKESVTPAAKVVLLQPGESWHHYR
ncbi:MAG: MBL fold metallo-hydrolase [Candidatus Binatia bacterium]